MDQDFVVELGIRPLGAVVVFGEIRITQVGKHMRKSLVEVLVGLAQIGVGIPPFGSLASTVVIESLFGKE